MATARVVRTLYRFIKKDRDQTLPERMPTARIPIKLVEGAQPVLSSDEVSSWNSLRLALENEVEAEVQNELNNIANN